MYTALLKLHTHNNGYNLRYLLNMTMLVWTIPSHSLFSAINPVNKYKHVLHLEVAEQIDIQVIYTRQAFLWISTQSVQNVLILLLCHTLATSLTPRD